MINDKTLMFNANLAFYVLAPAGKIYEYKEWDSAFCSRYIRRRFQDFVNFYKECPDKLPDFCSMSEQELRMYGFRPWGDSGLMLIPLYLKEILPQDLKVTSIFGGETELSKADNDNRSGLLAYGIYVKE